MKLLFLIFILLQNHFAQINIQQNQINSAIDSLQIKTIVETVRVVLQENPAKNKSTVEIKNFFDEMIQDSFSIGWKILLAIAIIFIMGYLNYRLNKFYNRYNLSTRIRNADLIKVVLHILIWTVTIFVIVFTLLKTSTLLILLFLIFIFIVLIISVSDLAKNIISGILILIDKPFEYGDWIKIGQYSGKVHSKNLRNTEIITEDDSLVKIPNSYFITNAFENLNVISKNKQVSFIVEVPPHSEISKIKNSLNEIVSLSIYNSINKPVEVIYKGINERGKMEFQIKAYVFDAKYESEFKSDVQENIAEIFGIS